jgi:hypothetical protein
MSIGRPSRHLTPFAAAAFLVVWGRTMGAQAPNAPEMPGHFLATPAVTIAAARRGCLELGDNTYTDEVHQLGDCVSLGFKPVGVAGGSRWYSSLAHRRWLLNDPAKSSADTAAESELVLLGVDAAGVPTRDTLISPLWHYRFEPEMLASVTPEIASVNNAVLIAIDACVNGTGGCSQSFLLRRGGTWSTVRLSFLDSLNRRFPAAINHGYHVDVRTLRGDAAVYSPNDANCCPSRVAEMRLRLRGNALEIVELRVRPVS